MENDESSTPERFQAERTFTEQIRLRLAEAILALKGLLEALPGDAASAKSGPTTVTIRAEIVNITAPAANMTAVKSPPDDGRSVRRSRLKLSAAEPLVRQHLLRRPHDPAKMVAAVIGCSTGLVAKTATWKANQRRLRAAANEGRDPKAIGLDIRAVNEAGENIQAQNHAAEEEKETLDAEIDRCDENLLRQIGDYRRKNPKASAAVVARALGCTVHDVSRWGALMVRLSTEQAQSAQEDGGGRYSEGASCDAKPRKRHHKSA